MEKQAILEQSASIHVYRKR